MHKFIQTSLLIASVSLVVACSDSDTDPGLAETAKSLVACGKLVSDGLRDVPDDRADRFQGKVQEDTARCRGGDSAVEIQSRNTPWVDWTNYWGTGDESTRVTRYDDTKVLGSLLDKSHASPNLRGIDGALIDLEYERVELIKFNLFDNNTYKTYVLGNGAADSGSTISVWPEMRLSAEHAKFDEVGGPSGIQLCQGNLIRFRTLDGICNDVKNPLMGSSNTPFARNVEFEETIFFDHELQELARNRHGDRLSLMQPDPQLISRKLFTRSDGIGDGADKCNNGNGTEDYGPDANCEYEKAPFFNVLAAFWIQFMTHDWFSHLEEGMNKPQMASAGCVGTTAQASGCRSEDLYPVSLVAKDGNPGTFSHNGREHLQRAPKTFNNTVTAWWDTSQIYGYDEVSITRVKRDGAKLAMDANGYLTRFAPACEQNPTAEICDNLQPQWSGQEWSAFPDNWTLGLSFYHNVFAREHNAFVDEFRAKGEQNLDSNTGMKRFDVERGEWVDVSYRDITDDELFNAARLVVSAMIAKIHTIEWTTQLLYNDPLFRGMNSNWSGLLDGKSDRLENMVERIAEHLKKSGVDEKTNSWYSVVAAGPGIFGIGNSKKRDGVDTWSIANPDHVNGGTNHFGSPFNFPEEFTTVYRLHPLVPDLLELRKLHDRDNIAKKVPAVDAFRSGASDIMQQEGIGDWALSMGRQRLGALTLNNHGRFLQNLELPHLQKEGQPKFLLDIAALDIIRDRERGVPRFNEFRRQYGLRQLTTFDDFIESWRDEADPVRQRQEAIVANMRSVYGTHTCDVNKVISHAQKIDNKYPNDCLGKNHGDTVDNIEDVDTVVGWLAEPTRPHGYAISETQFVVFILNASRRLFSDRFFTSSFRPEFYTTFGVSWVKDNGVGKQFEIEAINGHEDQPVSPMKRVLLRTVPELADELSHVVNVFDPWARDRGKYYSLEWKAQARAKNDVSFK